MEVNRIYQFCKGFEELFAAEIKHLLEYRVQLTDRTTYYAENDASQKEYECQFTFLAEEKRQNFLKDLANRVKDLKNLRTIDVVIDWRVLKDPSFITDDEFDALLPVGPSGTRVGICGQCEREIP